MKKVFGYVLGLVAALFAAGAVATGANADGNAADAASGSSDNASSGEVAPATGSSAANAASDASDANAASDASDAGNPAIGNYTGDDTGASDVGGFTGTMSRRAPKKSAKIMKRVAKKRIKKAKSLAADKKMRGRLHYRKDSRVILFQKGKKGDEVELFNRKGQEVKKFKVDKNGRFDVRLTKKQAEKLDKGGKYFRFDVHQKGYRPYEISYRIYK